MTFSFPSKNEERGTKKPCTLKHIPEFNSTPHVNCWRWQSRDVPNHHLVTYFTSTYFAYKPYVFSYMTFELKMCEHLRQDMRAVYYNVRFIRQCGLTNPCSIVSGWFVAQLSFSSHCSILPGKLENTSRLTFNIAMNDLLEQARASSIVVCDSVVADCASVIATIQWIKSNDLKYRVLAQRFDNLNQ